MKSPTFDLMEAMFNGTGEFAAHRMAVLDMIERAVDKCGAPQEWTPGWRETSDSVADIAHLSYGDIGRESPSDPWPNKPNVLFAVPYTGYSDYSGGTVEMSNFRGILEDWEGDGGDWLREAYGGYGTRELFWSPELMYRWATELELTPDQREDRFYKVSEWYDLLDGLQDYPLMDEQDFSDLEFQLEQESWEDWVEWDVTRKLANLAPELEDIDWEDSELERLFHQAAEQANEYAIHETGGTVYWDLDRIMPKLVPLARAAASK